MRKIAWELLIRKWLKGCEYEIKEDDEGIVMFFIKYKGCKILFNYDPEYQYHVMLHIGWRQKDWTGPYFSTMQCRSKIPDPLVVEIVKKLLKNIEKF